MSSTMQNMRWKMQNKPLSRLRSVLWIRSSRLWATVLLCGGLWLLLAWRASEYLVAGAALAGMGGFTLQQSRARARRRRAALDAYAEREIARAAHAAQRRNHDFATV
jgi:hypothetical protein